jgi:hypothetical protein
MTDGEKTRNDVFVERAHLKVRPYGPITVIARSPQVTKQSVGAGF